MVGAGADLTGRARTVEEPGSVEQAEAVPHGALGQPGEAHQPARCDPVGAEQG
jgi:hypothetical protein